MSSSIEDQSRLAFEHQLLMNYKIDDGRLRRLAFFFLVHNQVDIRLIALVVKTETEKLRGKRELSYDDHTLLSLKWSKRTFKQHLRHAKERNLLDADELRFAEEINRARDGFVHFEVGRFKLPHYLGKDVTSEEGYRKFLIDAMTFDVNVPFPHFF